VHFHMDKNVNVLAMCLLTPKGPNVRKVEKLVLVNVT
jgi:hypothetical protein